MNKNIVSGLSTPARVVCLVAVYFLAGLLGKGLAFMNGDVALVWPHSGIAVAAVLLFGYRFLPGVALGAFLFSLMDGKPLGFFTVCTAAGNCVAATVCAYLLRTTVKFQNGMQRAKDAVAFVTLCALLGTTINAFFNLASLSIHGAWEWEETGRQFVLWWVPNAMGCLLVAPLLLSWSEFRFKRLDWPRVVELLLCWAGILGATAVAFDTWYVSGVRQYPFAFLPYPFVVWAALRFGVRGASLGSVVVAGAAIMAVQEGRGPFAMDSEVETLLLLGCYIALLAVSNLLLAAAAAERRASEERYRAVVEDQTESICRFDRRGMLTFVNEAFCRGRGQKREDLLGQSFLPQVSAEDMDIPLSTFLDLEPSQPVLSYDARVTRNGQAGWEHCSIRALFDRDGALYEFQMVSQDITRRKQAEEALRASEEKVRSIMADAILTLDEAGQIVSANPASETIFARAGKELAGRPFAELLAEEDRGQWRELLLADRTETVEVQGRRRNGELFPLQVSISSLPVQGRAGHVLVARDISHPKKVEEELRHAQRVETVGRVAGGVAHDFNNLLSVIVGHASLILTAYQAGGKIAAAAQQILKAADRGSRLTRQLLVFNRKEQMQIKALNLNEAVGDMGRLLQRVMGENIQLRLEPATTPVTVRGDETMLDQVWMNLAVNARDAMPEGGQLTLKIETRELTAVDVRPYRGVGPGEFARVSVSDTGSGIRPDVLPRIFEPFFTTKGIGKGTGLGLPTVLNIIKQHRGFVEVESEPGRGTTFHVFLPLEGASTGALPQEASDKVLPLATEARAA